MKTLDIENLYRAFSTYKLREKLTGCYCSVCLDEKFNIHVHNTPLLEISEDDVEFYLMAVGILEEEGNDFKYFLPRIMEIILKSNDYTSHFYTIVWKILAEATKFLNEAERDLLQQFGQVYYNKARQSNDSTFVEDALSELNEAGIKVIQ